MRSAPVVLALAATALVPAVANAQLIQPISQNRSVSASSTASHVSGASQTDNPPDDVAPAGDFFGWFLRVDTFAMVFGDDGNSGTMSGYSEQDGGWNGDDAITLHSMSLNGSGGAPGGYSGSATVDQIFSYTFLIDQEVRYSLSGLFGGCPFTASLTLSHSDGTVLESFDSTCAVTPEFDVGGMLQPGEYTIEFVAGGSVGFDNPVDSAGGGNGGGAGGSQPLFTFQVNACESDLTGDSNVDVFDLLAFLDLWFSGDFGADLDENLEVDVFDLLEYLDGWFAGC